MFLENSKVIFSFYFLITDPCSIAFFSFELKYGVSEIHPNVL